MCTSCAVVVSLAAGSYQLSMGNLREYVGAHRKDGVATIGLQPPKGTDHVKLRMRLSDGYIIGFGGKKTIKKGKKEGTELEHFFYFKATRPKDEAETATELDVEENYNKLPSVKLATLGGLQGVLDLKKYEYGDVLQLELLVLCAAVVSEAMRFATVATYFTGLTNGVLTEVDVARLCAKYFLHWQDMSEGGDADVLLKR